jgi:flagellar basal body rod protein FlgF
MNRAAIGLAAAAPVFVVVAFVILRVEPAAGPLLAIAPPADDAPAFTAESGRRSIDEAIVAEQEFDAIEPAAAAPVSEERREQVGQLLRRLKPKQPESAIEIWVDEFCEMSDDDISFLIAQSGMLAGVSGGSVLSESTRGGFGLEMETGLDGPNVEAGQVERQSEIARHNLRNTMTIGHRGQVELTVVPADETADPEQIAMYRLSCGDVIVTGNRLHIALRTPGAVFFQLSDGRLTRNGRFTRLENGKLGLAGRGESVALQDSPIVPSDESWTISEDGRVVVDSNSAESLGEIRVVRVTRPEQLTSTDGVYFRAESSVISAEDVQLQAEALELSNVDVFRNQRLLP